MEKEQLLELILFLKETEYRIEKDKDVLVWIDFDDLKEFTEIFGYEEFCEGGKEVTLLDDCIVFNLNDFLYGDDEDFEYIIKKLEEFEEE